MSLTVTTDVPLDYHRPSFPSLYWPINPSPGESRYLYYQSDIWRFTLYWTLITYAGVHLSASLWAVLMQLRSVVATKTKPLGEPNKIRQTLAWVWIIPVVYLVVAGIEAVFAGSAVGLILGAVYNAGYFKMSTWMPFLWGLLNVSVLILSSFSIQGGL
jgi:Putative transmembrane protein 170